jgi:hypothetical protein
MVAVLADTRTLSETTLMSLEVLNVMEVDVKVAYGVAVMLVTKDDWEKGK